MVDRGFLVALASKEPTPGGGGASAYAGALAAALGSMVANLTVGKPKYAAVEEAMQDELLELETARARLLDLVDEDAQAFAPLAAAYGMPKATQEEQEAKERALQAALGQAIDVPLEIMRQCVLVIESADFVAREGSVLAVSDAGACAILAKGALQAASLNVRINCAALTDDTRRTTYTETMEDLLDAGCALADQVYEAVVARL